jgi:iron complex outermembrane receptor protein
MKPNPPNPRAGRPALLALAAGLLLSGGTLSAQRPDSTRRDTTRATSLAPLEVTVTRTPETRARVPAAVGTVDSTAIRRGQLLAGLDEGLGRIPGVIALNRFNPSLDQRLIIRGAGARGNFGVRGIRILLDGLPQTLPDGQSQLTNLDLGSIGRVEALLGSSSALHGNGAGGVLSFSTFDPSARWTGRLRAAGGEFGTSRLSGFTSGSSGAWSGFVSGGQYRSDGFRQHSRTVLRQLGIGVNRVLSAEWLLKVRYFLASSPAAENPGALTADELAAKPDTAAASNILRGADKSVTQHQLGLTLSRADARGNRFEATLFGLTRGLDNPLATAPPGPPGPTVGTFSAIDRRVGGGRLTGTLALGPGTLLSLGADAQVMRDDRVNRRSRGGAPSDTVTADQRETVSELGPFVSLHAEPGAGVTVTGAVRYDRVAFRVRDHYLADGVDQSGRRVMGSVSGSIGSSLALGRSAVVFGNLSSAFETPTTTELVNQSNGQIGFNTDLGPQRTLTGEVGARTTGRVEASLALYHSRITDPLVQVREIDGRAFFQNAGRIRIRGAEAGLRARPTGWLRLDGSYTFTDATFRVYRLQNGATTDTLDGRRVPGVPKHVFRAVAGFEHRVASLELEQQIVSSLFADDRNTIPVDGWGAGVSSIRLATSFPVGRARLGPFVNVQNLFDRRYVAAVTVNGFGGRVFEPAPGRWAFVGMEVGW